MRETNRKFDHVLTSCPRLFKRGRWCEDVKPVWHKNPQSDSCNVCRWTWSLQRCESVNPRSVAFPRDLCAFELFRGRMAESDWPLSKCQWIWTERAQMIALHHHLPLTFSDSSIHLSSLVCLGSVYFLLSPLHSQSSHHLPSPPLSLLSFTFASPVTAGK